MTASEARGAIAFMRPLVAVLASLLLLWPVTTYPDAVGVASGAYGEMLIGFDPVSRIVTGYFHSQSGGGQFSCIFYLTGRLSGSKALVSSYFPETPAVAIKGELTLQADGDLRLRLASEHGGCWNVERFAADDQPADFALDTPRPWTSIAVVRRDKAYFYDTPGSATHRKGYVVKGDGVGVRAVQPGWLLVDFGGGDRPASGWIRRSDVFPTH